MQENIVMEFKPDYLRITVSGTFDLQSVKKIFPEVMDSVSQHNLGKVLIDIRKLEGNISILDRYELGVFMSQSMWCPFRIVFLASEKHFLPDPFFATVLTNRGVTAKVVRTMEEAVMWLDVNPDIQ